MSFHEEDAIGKAYDSRLMRRLLTYLRPYGPWVAGALAAILVHSALQLVQPYLMKLVIDRHIMTGDLAGLSQIGFAFLAALVGMFVAEYVQIFILQNLGQWIMFDLRTELYGHLQRLDLKFYDRNPVGRIMTRVTTDVDALNELFSSGVVSVFGDIFTLVGIMVVLLFMDWRLALVAFAVLPLIALVTQWFRRNVRESYRDVRVWIARINAFLQENISGMATVQLFRRERQNLQQFDVVNREHRNANIASVHYYAAFYPAVEITGALTASLIIWFGGGRVIQDNLALGSLVAFLQYAQRFFRPISDMSEKVNTLQSAMAASERIFTVLDTPVAIASPARPVMRPEGAQGRVTFDGVWFAYQDEEYVLRDVSFEVAPGERVGIVGATGAGKTTLINVLMRFYDVNRGAVRIDGVDVREMDLAGLRRLFSLVLQDVHLFSGTVAGNVRLGNDAITDEDVWRAIASVHADSFVSRLSSGPASQVVERGATFSTGQKQLLSFARALAFDPLILVLDEATSNVDTQTELLIRDALHRLMAGRTTIAIAHRLSTIQDMDKILVLHKGQVREVGTHQELLARRGIYYKLYQLQYKDQELLLPAAGS